MKKINILAIIITVLTCSCEDKLTEIFIANSPIYMSHDSLRNAVVQSDARELNKPGKLYFKDNYIFIIEEMAGIHVIDNTNPVSPQNIAFINVPGAVDIAIKGTTLYADSYIDLVAIDIADLENIKEVNRVEKVFPYTLPPYNEDYPLAKIDEEKGVVIGWEVKKIKQKVEDRVYPKYHTDIFLDAANFSGVAGISSNGIGVGGSMARFGISENTLYAVDESRLHIFNISTPANPTFTREVGVGWNVETMFILEDKMFFGTQTGMRIYDISVPTSPMYISQFWHITSCDPVVVKDTLAFVTLRGGTNCWGNVNELDVLSIADIENPSLLESYPMEEPYGLGIDDNVLFVCDGSAGLKIYDATDPLAISSNLLAIFPDIAAFDVIPVNGMLFLIGEDGFYQYNYDDIQNIQLVSKIEIVKLD